MDVMHLCGVEKYLSSSLTTVVALGALVWSAPSAHGRTEDSRIDTYASFGVGPQWVKRAGSNELSKDGNVMPMSIYAEKDIAGWGLWDFGLGLQYVRQGGATSEWLQRISVFNPTISLGWSKSLGESGFEAGVIWRNMIGKGSFFDLTKLTSVQWLIAVGPRVRYRWPVTEHMNLVASVSALTDLNNPGRQMWQFPVEVALQLPFGFAGQKSKPVTEVAPPPPATERPKVQLNLDSRMVTFDVGLDTLRPKSEAYLKALAGVLAAQSANWESIDISGHTDGTGKPERNQKLSERRAARVRSVLVASGVAADRLRAKGFGDTQLLAGKALNDEAHRRVELSFSGVNDAAALQSALNSVEP